ncbi:putative signal transducing protein [Galbibacter mesophilus]|uniref:putative signal transducing protein n=1 Tax=Galbibacter mesophilus TaxID=379069 RepID=UPI00191CE1E0|nr:DUF2007 domain-containing protein [Galbibacter mesophilus]MCM5663242.1 DUF2007 domain-containing protein [Galbibacter mesophilus]
MENKDYIRIFTGSDIQATYIKSKLEEAGISPVIKNETESARLAGFGPSVINQVQMFVHQDEHTAALAILSEAEKGLNDLD